MHLDIRHDYLKALRAWHLAWAQRELAHRDHFPPEKLDDLGLLYESVIEELREAKEIEERAFDRFLQARDVLPEVLVTEGRIVARDAPERLSFRGTGPPAGIEAAEAPLLAGRRRLLTPPRRQPRWNVVCEAGLGVVE